MAIGIVDGLKVVDIDKNQRKAAAVLLEQIQYLTERTAIERLGQRIVLSLVLHELFTFFVFTVYLIIGVHQYLQFVDAV